MKFIWRFLRPHLWLAALAPLCVLLEVWAELMLPDQMAVIVDDGILGRQPDIIIPLGVRMLVFMAVGVLGGLLSIHAAGRVAYRFGADVRRTLYNRVSRLSFADIDHLQSSSLITRLSDDVMRVQQVVQASMRLLFRAPFLFVGAVFMALRINAHVSVVLVIIMVVSFLFVMRTMRRSLPLFLRLQQRRDAFVAVVREFLTGVRVVKAYTNEDVERRKFEAANEDLRNESVGVGRLMAGMMPVVSFVLNAGVIAVIYLGVGETAAGNMGLGGIMATINYLAQIQIALMMASHVIMNITQAEASIMRLGELLHTPTEDERDALLRQNIPCVPYANGDLEFRSVSFAYGGRSADKPARDDAPHKDLSGKYVGKSSELQLSGVSFVLPKGQTLAVMGETGSGKSTLVALAARFYDPARGTVLLGGTDIRQMDRADYQSHVGVAMQHAALFAGSIAYNLRMGCPDATDDELMEACRIAQIADFVESQPHGLQYHVEQGGANLSGGQKQRLCIARTLLTKPDVLILDDSLSALDMITESRIVAELQRLDMTKIIVTQRVSSLRHAGQILMLQAGCPVALGSHDVLMATSELYRELYNSQTNI